MNGSEILLLKESIDKNVEIETIDGELLVAQVLFVTHDEQYDEHDLLYRVVSSSMPERYQQHENAGGFVLDFDQIVSVRPYPVQPELEAGR